MSLNYIKRGRNLAITAAIILIIIIGGVLAYNYFSAQRPPNVLKIGAIMELTGDLARDGLVCKRGYDVWFKVVSQKGGIIIGGKQYKVELKYYDTRSDPGQAAAAVEKAVSEGMDILLGPYSSANALGAIPVVDKYGIPMFAGSPESHRIPEAKSSYTFQTLLTTKESPLAFKVIIQRYGIKTATLVASNDAFSQGLASTFRSMLNDLGVKIVVDETFPLDITDLTPLMSKAAAASPELIIVSGHPTHHILAVKALRELNYNPKMMIIHYGIDSPDTIENVGPVGDGILGLVMWQPTVNWEDPIFGDVNSFLKVWKETYPGIDPDYTAVSCAATASYVVALLQKHSITPPLNKEKWDLIKKYAEQDVIETVLGPIRYSTDPAHWHVNMELLGHVYIVQFQNGKLVIVYPDNVKQEELLFPKPTWR